MMRMHVETVAYRISTTKKNKLGIAQEKKGKRSKDDISMDIVQNSK